MRSRISRPGFGHGKAGTASTEWRLTGEKSRWAMALCFGIGIFVAWSAPLAAQQITPEPLPDPGIPGFHFPTDEGTILDWVKNSNQKAINLHAWGLWTALTSETDQVYDGQKLRVFETWVTPQDITSTEARRAIRPLSELNQLQQDSAEIGGDETITGFVKYDPTAEAHIRENNLLSTSALTKLLDSGARKIPDFPITSISLKPTFQTIPQGKLVDGRYYKMPAWPGPLGAPPNPGDAVPYGSGAWGQCIWIDIENGSNGNGSVDKTCGATPVPEATYNIENFIHFRLDVGTANALSLSEGDYAVLQAMHVASRETTRWTWQTFWWTPHPDTPHFPSSTAIANDRPPQLQGAARYYAHAPAYSMKYPPQPNTGGTNTGNSVYSYNPWLEAGFGKSVLPYSLPGTYDGRKVPNDVGMQTNCMSCHVFANFSVKDPGHKYAGDRYLGLDDPFFKDRLQVDFLWSIPQNAQ